MQVKNLSEELQPLHALKVELEVANGRLKSIEHFQSRLKVGAFYHVSESLPVRY